MRHHHLFASISMASSSFLSSPASLSLSKPRSRHTNSSSSSSSSSVSTHHHRRPSNHSKPSSNCSPSLCKHSPSATLDILILILVLFSGTFLLISYFSYIFQSLSLLLPPFTIVISYSGDLFQDSPVLYLIGFVSFFVFAFLSFEICCGIRSRKCGNPRCKGLKKAMEFDLQLQTEECLRSASKAVREIDGLPWKGGSETNSDYECLRSELRKMAPQDGRAVLLFRAKCGCPIAKLEGWGAKRGRRHKKSLTIKNGAKYR